MGGHKGARGTRVVGETPREADGDVNRQTGHDMSHSALDGGLMVFLFGVVTRSADPSFRKARKVEHPAARIVGEIASETLLE